jgi:hypothetical protein
MALAQRRVRAPGIAATPPKVSTATVTISAEKWKQIESDFRLWSFRLYYDRCFKSECDLHLRFAKSLVASCQPIRDRQEVLDWHARKQHQNDPFDPQAPFAHAEAQTLST